MVLLIGFEPMSPPRDGRMMDRTTPQKHLLLLLKFICSHSCYISGYFVDTTLAHTFIPNVRTRTNLIAQIIFINHTFGFFPSATHYIISSLSISYFTIRAHFTMYASIFTAFFTSRIPNSFFAHLYSPFFARFF